MKKMEINEKKLLTANKRSLGKIKPSDITTSEDVLRAYENIFKKIEKILENSNIGMYEFEVGKRKDVTHEVLYFFPGQNWGLISFDELGGCGTHNLQDVLKELYSPRIIRKNLIPILNRISRENQKKIQKLNSELGFLTDFLY
jgi:hypothetical protein